MLNRNDKCREFKVAHWSISIIPELPCNQSISLKPPCCEESQIIPGVQTTWSSPETTWREGEGGEGEGEGGGGGEERGRGRMPSQTLCAWRRLSFQLQPLPEHNLLWDPVPEPPIRVLSRCLTRRNCGVIWYAVWVMGITPPAISHLRHCSKSVEGAGVVLSFFLLSLELFPFYQAHCCCVEISTPSFTWDGLKPTLRDSLLPQNWINHQWDGLALSQEWW